MTALAGNIHPEFRGFWHPVAWSHEVVDAPLAVTLLGEPLLALRRPNGEIAVFADECPHRGAPLSLGRLDGDELVCAFHGWRFGPDGAATCIPSLGSGAPIPSRARLGQPAEVCERYGVVWVALEPPRTSLPSWPDADDDRLGGFSPTAHTSEVLAAYQTDNLLDSSHFPFLHGSLGSRNPLMVDHEVVDQHEFGFSTVRRKLADDNVSTEGWLRYTLVAPFTVLLRSEEPDGRVRQSFFQAVQPIDERCTRLFFMVRVPETDPTVLSELLAQEEIVQQEDVWITAALRRRGMPLVGGPDLHVRSDGNAILYRRVMRHIFEAADDAPPDQAAGE
jgi:phenylpropionate dioxygenase-like ring-hydroxylating dioxygenase large terminal subunit